MSTSKLFRLFVGSAAALILCLAVGCSSSSKKADNEQLINSAAQNAPGTVLAENLGAGSSGRSR